MSRVPAVPLGTSPQAAVIYEEVAAPHTPPCMYENITSQRDVTHWIPLEPNKAYAELPVIVGTPATVDRNMSDASNPNQIALESNKAYAKLPVIVGTPATVYRNMVDANPQTK